MNVGPDTVLGRRYRLTKRIAGGGMGEVWQATDEVLGRTVAVKILLPALLSEPGFAERFRGEARTMATISHPGVVNIFDYSSDQTVAYLVMEYIEGDPLSKTLAQVGRLTPGRTMALVAQAADALQAAHNKGIVHRDVKPGNLLVRPNGTLVLTDFGIARWAAATAQLTAAGSVLGTASYISPEQASGGVATPLSDVYGLGVVAYQCLSGRRPFEGANPVDIALRHVRDQPPPLPPDTPPMVRSIVGRALAKSPEARWPSASAMADACRAAAAALAGGRGGPAGMPTSGARGNAPGIPTSGGRGTAPGSLAAAGARGAGAPGTPPGAGAPPIGGRPMGVPAAGGRPTAGPGAGRVIAGAAGGPISPAPGYPAQPAPSGYPAPPAGSQAGSVRGAASVPVRGNTTHLPQGVPPGGAGPYAAAPRRRRSGLAIAGMIIGLLLLICLGGAWVIDRYAAVGKGSPGGSGSPTDDVRQAGTALDTDSPSSSRVDTIDCNALRKKTPTQAEALLRAANFVPHRELVPGKWGKIVDIVPCQGRPGEVITVQVGNGRQTTGMPAHPMCDNSSGLSCVTPTSRS